MSDSVPAFSEAEMRAALPDTDPPVLLMSYVQLTGDREFMERFRPHIRKVRDFADDIPPALLADLHERMVKLLCGGAEVKPPPLSRELITDMMTICVGEPVPSEYMPMLLAELGVEPLDPAADFRDTPTAPGFPANFRVGIIGAGMSGICAAVQLKRAGVDFDVFEKNSDIGGTWYENQYPGCGVDTMNHWYSYSFALKHDWSRYFVQRPEIHQYFKDCAERFGINDRIRLNTQVDKARWDAEKAEWIVAIRNADGHTETRCYNALVCAVGQLNNPSVPNIQGIESFAGQAFHSARWPKDLDVRGKRLAMIGTGATGTQIGPSVAGEVAQLDIYQRSAHWVTNRANYTKRVEDGKKWALRHIPHYAIWYRFQILWAYGDGLYKALEREFPWDNPTRSISAANEDVRRTWEAHLEASLGERPDLLAKSRPKYPPYGKRPLFDNDWFATLKRPNVELVQEGIDRVVPEGIRTKDGVVHPTDVIVFATGFQASKMVYSLDVEGRDGQRLRDVWEEDNPRAFQGSTVPGFPNFFLLYGPNTNLAHGGSIVFIAERQVTYLIRCLTELKRRGAALMDVTDEAFDRYNVELEDRLSNLVWSVEEFDTWYRNQRGRVTTNTPWRLLTYWEMTRKTEPADYVFETAERVAETTR
jgi:4-hydroxyacetophenone monooxygenase